MVEAGSERSKAVYIPFSRKNSDKRFKAMRMATENKMLPLYPGIVSDLSNIKTDANDNEARDRERLEQIRKSSEVWIVGELSREMVQDVDLAKRLAKRIRYFESSTGKADLKEIDAAAAKKERFF